MFRYARIVFERRWLVLFVFLMGAALFAAWAKRTPRIYQATGTILVEAMPPQVMGDQVRDVMTGPSQFFAMEDYLRTQRSVLLSDGVARQGIQVMQLAGDTGFWIDGMPVDPNDAVERLHAALTVEVVPRTEIFSISYRHRDPKQAKRVVDGLMDIYIENNAKLHERSNVDATRWLAEQADSLRQRLSKSELELYQFKETHDLLSVSLEDRVNNVTQQIDKLSAGLSDARLRKAAVVSGAEELRKMRAADPFSVAPAGVPTTSLLERKARYNEENEKLAELEARYEAAHPLVRRQKSKVELARAAVLKETDLVVLGGEARANEVTSEARKIASELAAMKQEGMRVNRLEIDYNRLKRDTALLSKQYELVAHRMKETELAAQSKVNNLQVLDYAKTPRIPVTPNLMRDAPLALLASLAVAVALAFAAHAADRRVRGQEDIEGRTGLRVLASIPFLRGKRGDLPVADDPHSTIAELYRLIRTNLLFADANRRLRRVLVTSAMPEDGRTFTAINLATVMAQCEEKKVLLIDCDLRATRVASALGVGGHAGLTDVVLGATTLDEAIQSTHIPNLGVLFAGPMPPSPAELLGGRRFQEILDACSERFDWVIIDSPPAGLVTDPAILAKACDGAIVVVRSKHTTYNQLARAERALADVSATVLGVVLNGTEQSEAGYGYRQRKRPDSRAAVRHAVSR